MKILFLTSPHEDYLADSMLHGLRALYGADCVDYPKSDLLYKSCPDSIRRRIRGGGFTLYSGLLEDLEIDRSHIEYRINNKKFDLIVFSDIWNHFGLFVQWRPMLDPGNAILMDGLDFPQVYPNAKYWMQHRYYWFLPRATGGFLYFKRELTPDSKFKPWVHLIPRRYWGWLPDYQYLKPVSYSIPREKILESIPTKTKRFAKHLVDPDVAERVADSTTGYAFDREVDYYQDLQASQFSVTTKRAGWDCLRHYEIAANGCVPCFKRLDLKPSTCAPHGLVPGQNCLSYHSADDLLSQLGTISDSQYSDLCRQALNWARAHTTETIAASVVEQWRTHAAQFYAKRRGSGSV